MNCFRDFFHYLLDDYFSIIQNEKVAHALDFVIFLLLNLLGGESLQ